MEAILELIGAVIAAMFAALFAVLEIVAGLVAAALEFLFVLVTQGKGAARQRAAERRALLQASDDHRGMGIESGPSTMECPSPVLRDTDAEAATAEQPVAFGSRQLSRKSQSVIYGMVVVVIVCVSVALFFKHRIRQQRIEVTRVQVRSAAERVVALFKDMATPEPQAGHLKEFDAWGKSLQLFVDKGVLGALLVVRSAGSDAQTGTIDDILSIRMIPSTARKLVAGLARIGFDKVKSRLLELLPEKEGVVIPVDVDFNEE